MHNDQLPSTFLGWIWYLFLQAVCGLTRLCVGGFQWLAGTMLGQFIRRNVAGLANRFRYEGRLISLVTRRAVFHVGRMIRISGRTVAVVFSPRRNLARLRNVDTSIRLAFAPIVALARRDRRTLCWTAASATGGLALLLMLSWQAFAIIDQVAATDPDHLVTTLRGDEQRELNAGLRSVSRKEPAAPETWETKITVADAGQTEPPPQPPAKTNGFDEFGLPKNDVVKTPFETEKTVAKKTETAQPTVTRFPENSEPKVTPTTAKKTETEEPDPFAAPPPGPTETDQPKTVETGNPFGPPPTEPEKTKTQPPAFTPVVDAKPSPMPLTLEIVRTDNRPDNAGRFLVTSLSALPDVRPDDNDLFASAGWTAVRWAPHGATGIIPTRYVQTTVTEGDPQVGAGTVAFSSTASSNWQIGTAKLQYDIILPATARVGERVPIRLRITNIGAVSAANVKLQIDLPEALAYSVGRKLTHTVGSLKPGEKRTARLTPVAVRAGEFAVSGQAVTADLVQTDRQTLRIEPATQTGRTSRLRNRTSTSQPCCGIAP